MVEDKELIRQYAAARSEAAFAELARRHLKMVYAAALRQVNGDAQLAEDVAQSVFTDLARKAAQLQHNPSLAGWLHTSTRFAAANAVRTEARRRAREQEVVALNDMNPNTEPGWDELRPVIDAALGELSGADREAIVLRYFEAHEFALIGEALGVSENTARMRVVRALQKLRAVLRHQGLTTTGAALAGALGESSAAVVPPPLAAHITGLALTHAASTASSTTSILKFLIMKKVALITASILAASLAVVLVAKSLPKTPSSPPAPALRDAAGVRTLRASGRFSSVLPGQTLIMGGWTLREATRMLVFITPSVISPTGAKVDPPYGPLSQIRLEAKFVAAPEEIFLKLGS